MPLYQLDAPVPDVRTVRRIMRAVIQRVSEASVTIAGQVRSTIGRGLLVLVAIEDADTPEDGAWLAGKLVRLRIFPDAAGLMNRSVQTWAGSCSS